MALREAKLPFAEQRGMRDTSAQDTVIGGSKSGSRIRIAAISVLVLAAAIWIVQAVGTWMRADVTVDRERLRLATVTRGELDRNIPIQGVIVAAIKPTLFAPSVGRVTLIVTAGDPVQPGQVLATIDSPELSSELAQAQSLLVSQQISSERETIAGRQLDLENQQAVELARVDIAAAERELRRAQSSWKYRVISKQDLEEAEDDLARARLTFEHRQEDARLFREREAFERRARTLNVEQQQLRVTELQRRFDALSVRSPVAGIVGNLAVEDKGAVAADAPLMSVVDLSRLELEVPLAQGYADDISVGMPAAISYAGKDYEAVVSAISPEVSQNTVATRMRFAGEQPDGLRQNQRLTGRIEIESVTDTLMVPRGPFFNSDGGRAMYRIEGEFAVRQPIVTGATSASFIEIVDGLAEGQTVIISSTESFEAADEVLIVD